MPFVKKIYVSKRILFLLLTLVILLVTINLYTRKSLGEISENTEFLTTSVIPKLILLQEITRNIGYIQANTLRHIATNDSAEMKHLELLINESFTENSQDLEKFKKYLGNDKEKELYSEIIANRVKYEEAREEILSSSRKNLIRSAYQMNFVLSRPAYESYGESLSAFASVLKKEVTDSLAVSIEEVNETKRIRDVMVFTAVFVVLAIGFVTTSINKKLKAENLLLQKEIDEKNIAQGNLLVSERKFAATLSSIGDAVIATDETGEVNFINDAACGLTGYNDNDVIGGNFDELFKIISEDDENPVENAVKKVINEGEKVGLTNHSILLDSRGGKIPVEESAAPIKDDNGKITGVVFVFHDVTEKRKSQKIILESLKEKEVLLKEVHHRVKNNLQIISSMLKLQSPFVKDKYDREIFKESQNRVTSLALVHPLLYKSSTLDKLDFKEYVTELVTNLRKSYSISSSRINCNVFSPEISLNIDTIIPCGLIINELVSNSVKYAFPAGETGMININMNENNGELLLTVEDNGIGLPDNFSMKSSCTLGMQLINALAEQLDGTVEIESERKKGTKVSVHLLKQVYSDRLH
jgi:PAS domain S-box-containing protein